MRSAISVMCAVVLACAASQAQARNDNAQGYPPRGSGGATIMFSSADSTLVRVYFAQNQTVWTGMPPGIAKNYARGKKLPPGIAMKMLPADLRARLPTREGHEYARVGQDVILIQTATGIVVDMIERVFG